MRPWIALPASIACAAVLAGSLLHGQTPAVVAPEGSLVRQVWHLGRVTGDLHRIIDFYHDLAGLGLRGARSPIPFYSVAAINEFVNAPAHAEFRAAFMPIPGTSLATTPQEQIYLEAFEYRNIDRQQIVPGLASPGVSSLRLFVTGLDALTAKAKASGVSIITAGAEPVAVAAPAGLSGSARAIMLRDPDGYPVELMEIAPPSPAPAPAGGTILGAHMTVVVDDLDASLAFYRGLIGPEFAGAPSAWSLDDASGRLRNVVGIEQRRAPVRLPGSAVVLELVEYRGGGSPYRPVFQDIGHGHVAFVVGDIEAAVGRLKALGATSISPSGRWTQINATTRAVYTRDPDGFFIEILERR